jgi:hypothetical protein
VYSELDKVTVVGIYLPAFTAFFGKEAEKGIINHTGQGQILIMDDQEPVLKIAGTMLNRTGHETFRSTDGSMAIKKIPCRISIPDNGQRAIWVPTPPAFEPLPTGGAHICAPRLLILLLATIGELVAGGCFVGLDFDLLGEPFVVLAQDGDNFVAAEMVRQLSAFGKHFA